MKKVIIGIHGLKNKPAQALLKKWWKDSILEGLEVNGYGKKDFKFELVYWADLNYDKPLDPAVQDENDPYFIRFPYAASDRNVKTEEIDYKKSISSRFETGIDKLILIGNYIKGFDIIADMAIKRAFIDLNIYYTGNSVMKPDMPAREAFRGRLSDMLKKYRWHRIMLIAHSMGSIIAYDTLMERCPVRKIEYFLTIGSPLGLPVILKKIMKEHYGKDDNTPRPFTPRVIKGEWINYADPSDRVVLVPAIGNKFMPNLSNVKPQDITVKNNYMYLGNINPHKSYGYLRCPELSETVNYFLEKEPYIVTFIRKTFTKLFLLK